MGESELTQLVGGGILVILVLDRVTNLIRVALNKRHGRDSADQADLHIAAMVSMTAAVAQGFAEQREDNKAIRAHLHSIADTLGGLVTGVAVIQDRRRGGT